MHNIIPLIFFLLSLFLPISAQKTDPVKIGLLIQDKTSLAARQGAELAIKMANEKGGLNGRPFRLLTKSMEGPWGTGSKQAVSLIFEDEVWALLGSHDGRNAHLVEQAATKSIVVFVSAWSSDPTLSQAFVPWFFNCVPNDRQQADILIEEIYNKRNLTRIATITDQAYDSNMSLKSYLQSVNLAGKNKPEQFLFDNFKEDLNILADRLQKAEINGIILFCQPAASLQIIRLLRQGKLNLPVFGSLSILNEDALSDRELQELSNIVYVPSGTLSGSKRLTFRQEYQKTYGKMPGRVAAYAFDGMNALMDAIRTSGSPDREKIQQALLKINCDGVTGRIQFDNMGKRLGSFVVSPFKP
jgi:branched-chain amino acid transport system substrate-binding protein